VSDTPKKAKDRDYGAVAAILSRRHLILNIGEREGVKQGDIYAITPNIHSIYLTDPDTDTHLGEVFSISCYVIVDEVYERFSIASGWGGEDVRLFVHIQHHIDYVTKDFINIGDRAFRTRGTEEVAIR
jgi:hypothetical protein